MGGADASRRAGGFHHGSQLPQQDLAGARPMAEVLHEPLHFIRLPQCPQHDAFEDAISAAETYVLLDDMR
jgi:hypothetical protein